MHKGSKKLCTKLTSNFSLKWWFIIAIGLVLLAFGLLTAFCFSPLVNHIIDQRLTLRDGAQVFEMWRKPPVHPVMKIYIYNVTNSEKFLSVPGTKPILDEIGPYVYRETWEKVDLSFLSNGTVTFKQRKVFRFEPGQSAGSEDDVVIVPNIPMLSATSQSKRTARFLRLAIASIMDVLKVKPFVAVTVHQLLWGYEDPLLKLAKDVVPKEQKLPYDGFGLLYGKNGTSKDNVTVFTGETDIRKFGLVDKFNGQDHLSHWKTDQCNSLSGSDGSIFPPHMDKSRTLHVYNKDMCRLLPLVYEKEVETAGNVMGYRFTPPKDIFATVEENPDNDCFCPSPPCAPKGLFNISLCQYDSPVMLSFPHFYLGNTSLLDAVEGVSKPDKEKHSLFIDVQPELGVTLRARARIQINLAVSQVVDIKQVATFPDIVFPIMWFEDGIDALPTELTDLLRLATTATATVKVVLLYVMFTAGTCLLVIAIFCLIRNSEIINSEL